MKKITLKLEDNLHNTFKKACVDIDKPMQIVLEEFVESLVHPNHKKEAKHDRSNKTA